MRLWMDDDQRVLTDEQLLQLIAYKGSLRTAAADGNVSLMMDDAAPSQGDGKPASRRNVNRRTLADYLQEG